VRGKTFDRQSKHEGPTLSRNEAQLRRFGNDCSIRRMTAKYRRQCARSTVLLGNHALDEHIPVENDAELVKRSQGNHFGYQTSFHVTGSASIEATVDDITAKRVDCPPVPFTWLNGVYMGVQDQGLPAAPSASGANDIRPTCQTFERTYMFGVRFQVGNIWLPDINFQAKFIHL
jgi:hypothetical protein